MSTAKRTNTPTRSWPVTSSTADYSAVSTFRSICAGVAQADALNTPVDVFVSQKGSGGRSELSTRTVPSTFVVKNTPTAGPSPIAVSASPPSSASVRTELYARPLK
jgi:hypothetical protein